MRGAAARRTLEAYRPGTRANQDSHLSLFIAFSFYYGFRDFPASTAVLGAFGEFLLRTYRAPKSVTNVLSSVRGFHGCYGFSTEGFEHPKFALYVRALPLTVRHLASPAPPLPVRVLEQLCTRAAELGPTGRVLAAFFSTLFFSMARASSLIPRSSVVFDRTRLPVLGDLRMVEGHFLLNIKWGKGCQLTAQGFTVPLMQVPRSPACPVKNLQALLVLAGGSPASAPLFSLPGKKEQRAKGGPSLHFTLARSWLDTLLRTLGLGSSRFSFHSFRRGSCTAAFEEGADLDDIKALGGWRSDAVSAYRPVLAARRRAAASLTRLNP